MRGYKTAEQVLKPEALNTCELFGNLVFELLEGPVTGVAYIIDGISGSRFELPAKVHFELVKTD